MNIDTKEADKYDNWDQWKGIVKTKKKKNKNKEKKQNKNKKKDTEVTTPLSSTKTNKFITSLLSIKKNRLSSSSKKNKLTSSSSSNKNKSSSSSSNNNIQTNLDDLWSNNLNDADDEYDDDDINTFNNNNTNNNSNSNNNNSNNNNNTSNSNNNNSNNNNSNSNNNNINVGRISSQRNLSNITETINNSIDNYQYHEKNTDTPLADSIVKTAVEIASSATTFAVIDSNKLEQELGSLVAAGYLKMYCHTFNDTDDPIFDEYNILVESDKDCIKNDKFGGNAHLYDIVIEELRMVSLVSKTQTSDIIQENNNKINDLQTKSKSKSVTPSNSTNINNSNNNSTNTSSTNVNSLTHRPKNIDDNDINKLKLQVRKTKKYQSSVDSLVNQLTTKVETGLVKKFQCLDNETKLSVATILTGGYSKIIMRFMKHGLLQFVYGWKQDERIKFTQKCVSISKGLTYLKPYFASEFKYMKKMLVYMNRTTYDMDRYENWFNTLNKLWSIQVSINERDFKYHCVKMVDAMKDIILTTKKGFNSWGCVREIQEIFSLNSQASISLKKCYINENTNGKLLWDFINDSDSYVHDWNINDYVSNINDYVHYLLEPIKCVRNVNLDFVKSISVELPQNTG